jgi:hypothetical protein
LLGLAPASPSAPASVEELMDRLTGTDLTACPCCHLGTSAMPPVGSCRLGRRFLLSLLKNTAELRPDNEK